MQQRLASRYSQIADPTVMELLSLSNRPGIISLAGGTPAPETFPTALIEEGSGGEIPLQYSSAQGVPSLRTRLATKFSAEWGRVVTPEEILITSGSQQALDLIGRTYLDPGDVVLIEDPTYFAALYAFSAYGPVYQTIDFRKPRSLQEAKLAYTVPTFQNPTGTTLSQIERQVIATMLATSNTILVEDDPYSALYFGRRPPRPIAANSRERVIYVTTLSKTVGPALRLGVVVASPTIIEHLTRAKTGMDLCTSGLTQMIAERVMSDPRFSEHLEASRKYYGRKARVMLGALKAFMPSGVTWTHPQGGMFVWVTLPDAIDSAILYGRAIEAGVAFVPGYIFSANKARSSSLRLSFALPSEGEIREGVTILAGLIKFSLKGGEKYA